MNVFFVETPLQLVNAIEAKHSLSLSDNHLVILLSEIYPVERFRTLLSDEPWESVRYVESRGDSGSGFRRRLRELSSPRLRNYFDTFGLLGLRRRLDRLAGTLGQVDRLFVGNYFLDHMRHLTNRVAHKELVLLDDGTTALGVAAERRKAGEAGLGPPRRPWRQQLVDRFIGWSLAQAQNATFFTMYDLAVGPSDRIVQHQYEFLRQRAAAQATSDEVWFLGQTLYYEGITEDAYLAQIRLVAERYADRSFVYLPHKGELPGRIDRIHRDLGVSVRTFEVPIEYQLAMRGPLPRILASFYSSALENCRIIFGPQLTIEAIYLDPALLPQAPEFVRTVYDYYESKTCDHFHVVRL